MGYRDTSSGATILNPRDKCTLREWVAHDQLVVLRSFHPNPQPPAAAADSPPRTPSPERGAVA